MNDEDKINEENLENKGDITNDDSNSENVSGSIKDQFENTISIDDEELPDVTYVESTEDGETLPTKDITKKLRDDLKHCRKEKEEYLTGWQRAKADYVNLQKELDSSRINISIHTKEKMAKNLMPALDSFDMAFGNKEAWENVDKNWRMGVEYIYTQLINGLSESGIEKIDKIGVKFDPALHHSITAVSTEKEEQDHTIESIIQIGYKIGDRVIRPARVNIYEYKQ